MALKRIQDYTDATTPLSGNELVELSVPGSPNLSRKTTTQDIANLANGGGGGGGGGGDVVGPASSVDNALPRFDGTTGKLLQASGVVVEDDDGIHGYRATINAQTGTTYTLVTGDRGKVIELTNASAITLTLPNSLPVGWCATIVQGGAGQVTLSPDSGATLRNRQSHTKIAGRWGAVTLYV
ncbi:MAG: hypothetical protein ACK4SA_25580, partial [Caldilinea sp.]